MNDTSWRNGEFDKHTTRLQTVSGSVQKSAAQAGKLQAGNGDCYGKIFGWAVAPALNLVAGKDVEFGQELATAISACATQMAKTRDDYAATEESNIAAIKQIEAELNQLKSKVVK